MTRCSLTLGLVLGAVLAPASWGQAPLPPGPRPSTPEPPLADDAAAPPAGEERAEPSHLQPAVYNQSVPLHAGDAPELPTPVVTIRVYAAETAAEGTDVTYKIVVQNRSQAKAHHVVARCVLAKNATFVRADPPATAEQPELQWQLNTLEPGATKRIEVVVRPGAGETELKFVGRVQFDHGQIVKTRISKPELSVKKFGPSEAVLYDNLSYRIEVANTGKVSVGAVRLIDKLPDGLEYERDSAPNSTIEPEKNQRSWEVGTLKPGERKTFQYRVIVKSLGKESASMTQVVGTGAGNSFPFKLTVREAKLNLQLSGPDSDPYVNQPAGFQVAVKNAGTAVLNNVRVTCAFPADCKLARASSGAQFFADSVQWIVPRLGPDESRTLTFHLTAPSTGRRKVTASARADRGLEQTAEVLRDFQGVAALKFESEGTPQATIGKDIKYTVTVTNTGTGDAGNVRVTAHLPPEVEFHDQAQPPYRFQGAAVAFDPILIPAHRSATYTLTVTARNKGEARFRFELLADHMRSGVAEHQRTTVINGDPNVPAGPRGEPKDKKSDLERVGSLLESEPWLSQPQRRARAAV